MNAPASTICLIKRISPIRLEKSHGQIRQASPGCASPSWKSAAREFCEARQHGSGKPPQPPDPQLLALLDPAISFAQAQRRLLERHQSGAAAASTIEALMFSLRDGIHALTTPATLERLSQLDERQLSEVAERVQNFRQTIASAWTPDEVKALVRIWGQSHE
jgi:hypothetical protein